MAIRLTLRTERIKYRKKIYNKYKLFLKKNYQEMDIRKGQNKIIIITLYDILNNK